MDLSENIRRLRKEKGLTQEQVAQALGVTAGAVNKWERSASCPDLALLSPWPACWTPTSTACWPSRPSPTGRRSPA